MQGRGCRPKATKLPTPLTKHRMLSARGAQEPSPRKPMWHNGVMGEPMPTAPEVHDRLDNLAR